MRAVIPAPSICGETTFVLRYEVEGKRKWETLPSGIDYAAAKRMALEKELALSGTPIPEKHYSPVPAAPVTIDKHTLRSVVDAYIDNNNLRPKTIQGKQFELKRWASFSKTA